MRYKISNGDVAAQVRCWCSSIISCSHADATHFGSNLMLVVPSATKQQQQQLCDMLLVVLTNYFHHHW
jgi:hypothetical protein